MQQFVIRSLATTGVIAGLLFTGAGVAAAQPEDDGSLGGGTGLLDANGNPLLIHGPNHYIADPTEDWSDWSG